MDFSYLLYIKRKDLWDALQGVAAIAQPCKLPTLIVFPDHILPLPLETWGSKERLIRSDEAQFGLMTSIYFPWDQAIDDYLDHVSRGRSELLRAENPAAVPIGCIYLTVNNQVRLPDSEAIDPDLALLDFGTPGTTMSLLFDESASIRKRFTELLEQYAGICGVFNREESGTVFWLHGPVPEIYIPDPYLHPAVIAELLG